MKKVLSIALSILLLSCLTILAGCSSTDAQTTTTATQAQTSAAGQTTAEQTSASASGEKVLIGYINAALFDKFQSELQRAAEAVMPQYNDKYKFVVVDAAADKNKELTQIEDMISMGCKAIVFTPLDPTMGAIALQKCQAAGVKLIAFNIKPDNFTELDGYAGSESIDAGIMQADYIVGKIRGGKANVVILMGTAGQEASRMRTSGNEQVIAKYPDSKVVSKNYAEWDRAKATQTITDLVNSGAQFDTILCNNDEMAIGAWIALQSLGKEKDVVIGGVDATLDALNFIKDDKVQCSVFQSPKQAATAITMAVSAIEGKSYEKVQFIPYELVTKENIQTYIDFWSK